jgi:RNA 3'-phosphate cyclase
MIKIDGKIGYGQVLRTSIALSTLTGKPVKIFNIRVNRPNPGLAAQHLTSVKVAAEFCNAEVKGLKLGSLEIEFFPKEIDLPSKKRIDIGTAGNIGLFLQTLFPILLFGDKEVELEIKGGTAGLGAPPIEFLIHVLFPILEKMGVKKPLIEIERYGFYPKGGGLVRIKTFPIKSLKSLKLVERGSLKKIEGISVVGSLPEDIAKRQAASAKKILMKAGFNSEIKSKVVNTFSPGTFISLWAIFENTVLGNDALGEKGKPAEKVGEEVALGLLESIRSNACLDKFLSDQIIPFLVLAKGKSEVKIEKFTDHVMTNLKVCEMFFEEIFEIDEENRIIKVNGIGFEGKI